MICFLIIKASLWQLRVHVLNIMEYFLFCREFFGNRSFLDSVRPEREPCPCKYIKSVKIIRKGGTNVEDMSLSLLVILCWKNIMLIKTDNK